MRKLPMEARRKIREDYADRIDHDARIVKALLLDADYDEKAASDAKWIANQSKRSEDAAKKKLDDYTFAIEKGDVLPMAMHKDKLAAAAADVKRWRDIAQAAESALAQGGIKRN